MEAPDDILRQMLTLRLHLDDATPENGPLQAIAGSHLSRDCPGEGPPQTIYARAGDVLAMRPLLLHASGESRAGTMLHRRVIHLEFAGQERLPEGYCWQRFVK
jgi:ectoine hydroxylase-related dioxygenase (phytanoyl-CoA dioxygenase family)